MNDNCEFSKYAGNFLSNPNTAINTKNIPVQSGFKVVINNQNINTNSNNVNINNNINLFYKAIQMTINKSSFFTVNIIYLINIIIYFYF